MRARWPHAKIPDASIALWYDDLKDLPVEQVLAGAEAWYRDGKDFPPNGGQTHAKVAELDRADPHFGAAWRLVNLALLKHGVYDWPQFYSCLPPAVAEAAKRMRFETNGGYLKSEESTVRAQFREIYKAVCNERRRDDAYAGIPSAGLRGLEKGPRKLGKALQRAIGEGSQNA